MNDQRRFRIVKLAIIAATLLLQCGCSVVGLGIGEAIDSHKPDSVTVQGWRLATIKQGSPLKITLNDGSTITGRFTRGMPATAAWIDTLYMRARSNDSGCVILPALGDTVEFIKESNRIRGRIDYATCRRLESDCDFCFGATPVDSSGAREFCLKHLLAVRRADGGLLKSGDIANAIDQSHTFVPLAGIEITTPFGVQQTPLYDISRVVVSYQKHGQRIGFLIGAIIDVVILIIWNPSLFSLGDAGWGTGSF